MLKNLGTARDPARKQIEPHGGCKKYNIAQLYLSGICVNGCQHLANGYGASAVSNDVDLEARFFGLEPLERAQEIATAMPLNARLGAIVDPHALGFALHRIPG